MNSETISAVIRCGAGKHEVVSLSTEGQRKLVHGAAALGISGGAIYDAVIGATCAQAGLKLVTLDARARPAYAVLGVTYELLT